MANILLTEKCNMRCPYCFAMEHLHGNEISFEDFKVAVDFISKNKDEKIGLLGGEPLLHPSFDEFLAWGLSLNIPNHFVVFTNGLLLEKHLGILSDSRVLLLINVNDDVVLSSNMSTTLVENIESLVNSRGGTSGIQLGYNLFSTTPLIDTLLSLIKRYKFPKLRLSLSIPEDGTEMSFYDHYLQFHDALFFVFEKFAELDVLPQYDCNIVPPCFYSKADKEKIRALFGERLRSTNLMTTDPVCKPVLDIYPNLDIARCFGCGEERVPLSSFLTPSDAKQFFTRKFDFQRFVQCSRDKSNSCYLLKTLHCNNGCRRYKGISL